MPEQRVSREFLAALWREQEAAGLNLKQLGAEIKADVTNLSRMRRGKRGRDLTLALALRAADRFPSLRAFFAAR